MKPPRRGIATINRIISETATIWGLDAAHLRGTSQMHHYADARHMAMYLVRTVTGASLPEIGQVFGGRHHTTVLYALRKVELAIAENTALAEIAKHITAAVEAPAVKVEDTGLEKIERLHRSVALAVRVANHAQESVREIHRAHMEGR